MGLPKRRHSKSRGRKRRAQIKLVTAKMSTCSHCGQPKVAHHICGNCGYYADKQITAVKA